jgi:hypothetical protein
MSDSNRKATMAPGEQERIDKALATLAKDPHSPREISVRYVLFVYNEFPKHVTVGKDDHGNAITELVNDAAEEKAALDKAEAAKQPE